MEFSGKRVTVIGLAKSGQAAARLLKNLGARVKISEQKSADAVDPACRQWVQENRFESEWGHTPEFIRRSDLLVISPGVRIDAPPVQWARSAGIPVWGEIELAGRLCPCPMIAVTGSNGKTTVATLIAGILREAGHRVFLGGNIGNPFSDHVRELGPADYAVLEISSFQLETIVTFKPRVAVFLNFSQNHLDRHQDMEEYFNAKKRIFMNQDEQDFAVLNADDEKVRTLKGQVRSQVHFFNAAGPDEAAGTNPNFRAAFCATGLLGVSPEARLKVFRDFHGVEHRLENVRCLKDVEFINDSKATTAESGRWALERIDRPVIMICGGRDKQIDFSPLKDLVRRKVRTMIVIGEARQKLKETFHPVVTVLEQDTLAGAVRQAADLSRPGDSVLLSPMCASFDMFRNFEERGKVFKDLVNSLPG